MKRKIEDKEDSSRGKREKSKILVEENEPEAYKRIIYTSRLNTACKDDIKKILGTIFQSSDLTNKRLSIGGLIYCNFDTFNIIQILEGPEKSLDSLFTAIAKDSRHTRVNRLYNGIISMDKRWIPRNGLKYGTHKDWKIIKKRIPLECPSINFSDIALIDLRKADNLPLAGDLDLSLVRLVYRSKLKKIYQEKAFSEMQLIIELAQKKNELLLIGGVLHMNDKSYDVFQCLEGPKNAVLKIFEHIKVDKRHEKVERILFENVTERRYKTWGMVWADHEGRRQLKEILRTVTLDIDIE